MLTNWPTAAEVTSFLTSVGVSLPGGYTVGPEVDALVEEVHTLTGWRPFKKEAADSSRTFNPVNASIAGPMRPQGGIIVPLDAGLLELTSVTMQGRVMTLGRDFWLEPTNRLPYNRIRLAFSYFAQPQSIIVTGKWGYREDIPADLWLAIRDLAAYRILSNLPAKQLASALKSWKEGTVDETYDGKLIQEAVEIRYQTFVNACGRYKRVTIL